ncbi:MAG: hypothetical protein HZB51_14855 [Chloroflexi bacterium]|nr:hypothetical protein [Chloroflexota bacterium]
MPDQTPRIQMIIADPKTAKWSPPQSNVANVAPERPREMTVPELETSVNFKLQRIAMPEAQLISSALFPKHQTYYGEFGNGAQTLYEYVKPSQTFVVIQRQTLRSDQPFMFMYGPDVKAFQKVLGSGEVTVVIPAANSPHKPFAECVMGEMYITVHFLWNASETDILRILGGLLNGDSHK